MNTTVTASLTVIPAIFKDPERALANLVEAKAHLDLANAELAKHEAKDLETIATEGALGGRLDQFARGARARLGPLVAEVERARSAYDVALTVYQEAARARDAAGAEANAKASLSAVTASNEHAKAVRGFTSWIAVAAIIQALVGVGLLVEGCVKIGPR